MTNLLLGIDLGTSAVKVVIVDTGGHLRASASAEYPTLRPEPNQAEQHPVDWWRATVTATRRALSTAGTADASHIAGIGVTGQMHGTVLLGAANEVLAPAIIWADGRGATEVAEITARVGPERLIELTGSAVATGFQAATILWLQKHHPRLWRHVHRVLLPKDYLRWRLTWEHATDPSDASGTLLCDVRTRDWSDEVLRAVGIARELLPPVRPSGAITGHLRPEPAAELGLRAGIPVATGGGDAPCAALGAGVVGSDTLLLTFSTGAQALLPRQSVAVDRHGRLHTFCSVLEPGAERPGWYTMGATLAAGMALHWLRHNVFALTGSHALEQMASWAESVPPGAGGLIFLPYLVGERAPHLDPYARGVYLGLTARHGRAEMVRATLEGVAFATYDAFLALRDLGAAPERIVAGGGGARLALWRQIVADLFGLPVFPLRNEEQTATGAAVLAGGAEGYFDPFEAARAWAVKGPPTLPSPAVHDHYHELFAIYRNAYRALKDDMATLGRLEAAAPT